RRRRTEYRRAVLPAPGVTRLTAFSLVRPDFVLVRPEFWTNVGLPVTTRSCDAGGESRVDHDTHRGRGVKGAPGVRTSRYPISPYPDAVTRACRDGNHRARAAQGVDGGAVAGQAARARGADSAPRRCSIVGVAQADTGLGS